MMAEAEATELDRAVRLRVLALSTGLNAIDVLLAGFSVSY